MLADHILCIVIQLQCFNGGYKHTPGVAEVFRSCYFFICLSFVITKADNLIKNRDCMRNSRSLMVLLHLQSDQQTLNDLKAFQLWKNTQ